MILDTNKNILKSSRKLIRLKKLISTSITIGELIELLSDDGIHLLVIILIAPFLIPVSIPGSSTIFGVIIILLEISFIFNKAVYLPKKIKNYELSKEIVNSLFEILDKFLGYIEKISKPREKLVFSKYILKFNAIVIILLSFLLFLPLPIPFTDFTPAIAILILTVSSMENDMYLMLLSYLVTIGVLIYFASVGYFGIEIIKIVLNYLHIKL